MHNTFQYTCICWCAPDNFNETAAFTTQPIRLYALNEAQIPLGSSRLDSTRLDTFDVSSKSSRAVRLAWHSQAWTRHAERVEACRVETWRAKWNLGL